jgi:hypothetical protein
MKNQILTILLITTYQVVIAQSGIQKQNPVLIGQESSNSVSKVQLTKDPVLRMPVDKRDYHIVSYQVSYLSKEKGNHLIGPFLIQGDKINTGKAAMILDKAQPGDKDIL